MRYFLRTILILIWSSIGDVMSQSLDDFLATLTDVKSYEIVEPRIESSWEPRTKRSKASEAPLRVSLGNWILLTSINDALILADGGEGSCEVRHGSVLGKAESLTAVTVCDGPRVYGLIWVAGKSYFVQPLADGRHFLYESRKRESSSIFGEGNSNTSSSDVGNVPTGGVGPKSNLGISEPRGRTSSSGVRAKRNSMICNTKEFYNLTGDMIDIASEFEKTGEPESENFELPIEEDAEHIGYFFDRTWERNKLPKRRPTVQREPPLRWLEIGIAADYSVIEFHGSRVQQYIMALFNIVSAIYKDPSLESNLRLVIVRMMFYGEKKDGMVRRGNAKKSLENVNRWNRHFLSVSTRESHDVAVWLTRLDLGGPSGYAPVSGVCDPARSCALNRDEGLTSAFIIAHELAHILGLTHDGDEAARNFCGEEASMGSVMAPMVAATFHQFHWSSCSKKEFHKMSRNWECLLNQPDAYNATLLKATVQATFTMDEQCRMEFGEGYTLCRSFDLPEPCSHLWCGHDNSSQICRTKKGPPLEGTECGEGKWCINGYCEIVDRRKFGLGPVIHNARNGGWGGWSPWGKCSRSCGVGAQFRSRECNEPSPAYGGANCEGDKEEFRICEISECPEQVDLRAEQCARLQSIMGFPASSARHDSTWLPYEPEAETLICQLICRSRKTGEIFNSGENLLDGTPCRYGESDICVQGKCRIVGCDRQLNSEERYDDCGECGGGNRKCRILSSGYQRKMRRGMTRLAVLPRSSDKAMVRLSLRNLAITDTPITLTIRDRRRRRNDFGEFDSMGRAEVLIVEGAVFTAEKFVDEYTIRSRGPLLSEVVVSLGVSDEALRQGASLSVSTIYTIHEKDENATTRYSWLLGGWGPCSASCGGGIRQKTVACKDEITEKLVSKKKCPLGTKPSLDIEKCNLLSCEFKWIPGEWEECTVTCGLNGVQHRQIYCVHVSVNTTKVSDENLPILYREMLPPDRCGPPPKSEQECNKIPCQGRWEFTDWSSCSQSCGRGMQSRTAKCGPDEPTELLFDCGESAPFELRACKTFGRQNPVCYESCRADLSQYCSLPVLQRYCEVPGFGRRCCSSCRNQ